MTDIADSGKRTQRDGGEGDLGAISVRWVADRLVAILFAATGAITTLLGDPYIAVVAWCMGAHAFIDAFRPRKASGGEQP